MKCKRCGTKLIKKETSQIARKVVKNLGIPFGGTYICPKCYSI